MNKEKKVIKDKDMSNGIVKHTEPESYTFSRCDTDPISLERCLECRKAWEESAESAIRRVFYMLGVDTDSPSEVEQFREDLRFSRNMRKHVSGISASLLVAVVAGILTMLATHGLLK